MKERKVQGIAAFSKFMHVLQTIADVPGGMTLSQLYKKLPMPRPTVHRIISGLVAEGLVIESAQSGRLQLGIRLISMAYRSWSDFDIRAIARPYMERLAEDLDETVHLAVNGGSEMIYIDKIESSQTVRMASRIGAKVAMHSSSVGKAWLASLPDAEYWNLLSELILTRHTIHTLTTRAALEENLAQIKVKGYATDLQENELDICCYGVSIVDQNSTPLACISVSMPRYRFESCDSAKVINATLACARQISEASAIEPPD